MRHRIAAASWIALGVALLATAPGRAQSGAGDGRGDIGVSLAMSGEAARAESIFVSMLSHSRGDARALNNLGNLRLLRGELGVALAFYDRALRGDSADAGIHLNRATALMLMGDEPRAEQAAATGVRLAGGVEAAQALIGITSETPAGKADQKAYVNKNEIRALLKSAASAVPGDSARAAGGGAATPAGKGKTPTWRSAGPRASDQSDAAAVLYWKR